MKIYIAFYGLLTITGTIGYKKRYYKPTRARPVFRTYGRPDSRNKPEVRLPDPTHFQDASRASVFVDKTMLMKDFINLPSGQRHIMVTYPNGFGKSTNLDMIRRFFQIDVDKSTGEKLDKKSTPNYQLFTDPLLNLSIAHDQQFIAQHFGEYPVLHMSFEKVKGECSKTIVKVMCQRIRHLITSYEWLYKVMKAKHEKSQDEYEKENLKVFAEILKKEGDEWDSANALSTLMYYLKNHFKKDIIVLIDDFDSPLIEAVNNGLYAEELQNFIESLLATFLQETNTTSHAILAGVTHLPRVCESKKFCDVDHWYFLNNHRFVEYFGFTEAEVQFLAKKDGKSNDTKLKNHFDGYYVADRKLSLYEPRGVVRDLQDKPFEIVEVHNDEITKIMKCVQHKEFLEDILKLIGAETISFELVTCCDFDDMDRFVKMIRSDCSEFALEHTNFYYSHLFEHGYLSYANDPLFFRIPNTVAQRKIKLELKTYFQQLTGVDMIRPTITLAMNEIVNKVNTSLAVIMNLTEEINSVLQMKNKLVDDYHLQALIFGSIFCNVNTSGEAIKIKKDSAPSNESVSTNFNYIVLSGDDKSIVLIAQLTLKRKARKAVDAARKLVPAKPRNSSHIAVVKYLGLNLDTHGQVELYGGPNLYDW